MASTHDLTNGSAFAAVDASKVFVIGNTLDTSANNIPSGDTAKVLNIPAGTFVSRIVANVKTAEGGAATVDIGDGDDPDGWHDGLNVNSVAKTINTPTFTLTEGTPNAIAWTGYTRGKLYTAADTIDILANAALDAAIVELKAYCIDMS